MELISYIENHTHIALPQFKHPTKLMSLENSEYNADDYYSEDVTIPDKLIINEENNLLKENSQNMMCCLLFGYQLQLKDWEQIQRLYSQYTAKIKLYRGNHATVVSDNLINAKSYIKGQKQINQPSRTLIKRDQKSLQSCAHIYVVELTHISQTQCSKIIYYLPSVFNPSSHDYPLQCIKSRYFNNKILQILSEYVSLDNNSTSCFKDLLHHDFQSIIYTGKVTQIKIFIKLTEQQSNKEVSESFIQKLSQISTTDKHLMDDMDPLDFCEIKKQIRKTLLQEKRIRKSLTYQKIKIVQEIENALEFLNLKELYPQKLTYGTITSQMLKKIRSQNIDSKTQWIKQQSFIMNNLDARLIDLQRTKAKLKENLLAQEKANYESIQEVRNQIKCLEASIRYEHAEKINKTFNDTIHNRASTAKSHAKISNNHRNSIMSKGKQNNQQAQPPKLNIQEIQRERLLKYEMIKAEFEMQKEFIRRKAQYARAAEEIFNYLIDC